MSYLVICSAAGDNVRSTAAGKACLGYFDIYNPILQSNMCVVLVHEVSRLPVGNLETWCSE